MLWTVLKLLHPCSTSVDSIPRDLMCLSRQNAPSNSALCDVVDDTLFIRKHAVINSWSSSCIIHAAEPIFSLLYTDPSLPAIICRASLPRVSSLISPGGFSLPDFFMLILGGACVHTLSFSFSCGEWGEIPAGIDLQSCQ